MIKPLTAAILLSLTPLALAQTGPELLLKPFAKEKNYELRAVATVLADGTSDNGDTDFQLSLYELQGRALFLPENKAKPGFGFNYTMLDLDTDDPALPGQLVDTSIAIGTGLFDNDGWAGGITFGIGQATSDPFSDGDGYYGMVTLLAGKQLDESSYFGLALDYDGNRTIFPDIPLPGFQYRKRVDDRLTLALGVPFSYVEWKPASGLRVFLQFNIPDNFDVALGYEVVKSVTLFVNYNSRTEAFKVDELPNNLDRVLFEQRRVEAGVRWELQPDIALEVAGGYAFDQDFRSGFDSRDTDKISGVSDEAYGRIALDARF